MLDFSEFALLVELFDEQEFAAVDDGFGHHVFEACFFDFFDDLAAFVDGGGHGDGAHDVFAGVECLEGHPGVIGDGAVDVYEVDGFIVEDIFVAGVAFIDAELVAAFFEFSGIAAADGGDVRIGVGLVDGNEFSAEAQSDHGHIELFAHGILVSFAVRGLGDGVFGNRMAAAIGRGSGDVSRKIGLMGANRIWKRVCLRLRLSRRPPRP
ncbi:MAG: hypothetical protein RL215_233 [Planctomycetota bacterium]